MVDNSAKIAALETLLESGAASVTVDGVTTSIDRESLRKELQRLRANDTTKGPARPVVCGLNLANF